MNLYKSTNFIRVCLSRNIKYSYYDSYYEGTCFNSDYNYRHNLWVVRGNKAYFLSILKSSIEQSLLKYKRHI